MVSTSAIALLSVIASAFSIFFSIFILRKVFQENHRKPWIFIGVASIFFAFSQLIEFFMGFDIVIVTTTISQITAYLLDFIATTSLAYGLFMEVIVLKYMKGKFVKFKLIPVQEGSFGGELDINVSTGESYLAYKKDKAFFFKQFNQATKKGFEGFLLSQISPKDVRSEYKIEKSPILWFSQIQNLEHSYVKMQLDSNAEVIDPIQLNQIISYVDNFLDQSQNPFILIELDSIFKVNSPQIVMELISYMTSKIKRFDGVLIATLNSDVLSNSQLSDLKQILRELEN